MNVCEIVLEVQVYGRWLSSFRGKKISGDDLYVYFLILLLRAVLLNFGIT